MKMFEGRTAMVTGAGQNIGKEIALDFAKNGANVIVCDYNEESVPPEYGYYAMEYDALDSIWTAANELAEGEYSVVIETEFGFHSVMRAAVDSDHVEQNMESIAETYERAQFEKYLSKIQSSLTLEYTEYGMGLDLAAMS